MRADSQLLRDRAEQDGIMVGQHPALARTPEARRQVAQVRAGAGGEIEQARAVRQRRGEAPGQRSVPGGIVERRPQAQPVPVEAAHVLSPGCSIARGAQAQPGLQAGQLGGETVGRVVPGRQAPGRGPRRRGQPGPQPAVRQQQPQRVSERRGVAGRDQDRGILRHGGRNGAARVLTIGSPWDSASASAMPYPS